MCKIHLDTRLQAVFDEILPCDCLVDIGTDHGKIPIKAVIENKCNRAIAADISAYSLNKAINAAIKYKVTDKVECLLGDGLDVVKERDCDTVVIAGMGGLEIVNIIKNSIMKFKRYILLPHRNAVQLREYLAEVNLYRDKDYMIECNNKFYSLIVAVERECKPTYLDLKYGKSRNTSIFEAFIAKEIEKLMVVLEKNLEQNIRVCKQLELKELKEIYESIANC